MPLPRDRGTVGEELKLAQTDLLLGLARDALNLHHKLEGLKFTNADDCQHFRYDLEPLERVVAELDLNAKKAARYYNDSTDPEAPKAEFLGREESDAS